MDISEFTARHNYGTWRYQRGWKPLHVTGAKDCWFWDASGKRYLDFSSQLICSNLGHQNEAIVEAICRQARELAFISPAHTCDVRAALSEALLPVMPQGDGKRLDKFFYERGGVQDRAVVHREEPDHRQVYELPWSDGGGDCGDGGLPALVGVSVRDGAGGDSCAGGELLPVSAEPQLSGLRDRLRGLPSLPDRQGERHRGGGD
jgi:Aminotransferase class-III